MSPPYTKNRHIVLNRDYQYGFYLVHFYTSLFSFYLSIKRLYSSKTRSGDSDFIWRLGVSSLKKKPLIFQAIDLNKVFLYPCDKSLHPSCVKTFNIDLVQCPTIYLQLKPSSHRSDSKGWSLNDKLKIQYQFVVSGWFFGGCIVLGALM